MAQGTHDISIAGVVVGQIVVNSQGQGSIDWDTNDGTLPPGFPEVCLDDGVDVGGQVSGTLVMDCS
ncbi:MAG: hypothetical protein IID37_14470 [Planctomycetes bacterium]|nr:hypothetical protein [Planctomycetota bacterium]